MKSEGAHTDMTSNDTQESVGQRDCGWLWCRHFNAGNYCQEEGFLREKKKSFSDFPVGLQMLSSHCSQLCL